MSLDPQRIGVEVLPCPSCGQARWYGYGPCGLCGAFLPGAKEGKWPIPQPPRSEK